MRERSRETSIQLLASACLLSLACGTPPSRIVTEPAPVIVTDQLPEAQVGELFRVQLEVLDGERPLHWSLVQLSDPLKVNNWLTVDPDSGVLWGTPPPADQGGGAIEPAVTLTVEVEDAVQRTHQKVLSLAVRECAEGTSAACNYVSNTACFVGSRTCVGGEYTICGGTDNTPSTSTSACGATCGSCTIAADRCSNGKCACGSGVACDVGYACCPSGAASSVCANLAISPSHCGTCTTVCPTPSDPLADAACVNGQCTSQCHTNYKVCPGSASCVSIRNESNCGDCGKRCGSGATCTMVSGVLAQCCTIVGYQTVCTSPL